MDKRALKILFDTFWSPAGWKDNGMHSISPKDFAYAKSKGMMFKPVRWNHNRVLRELSTAIRQLNRRCVADAFLASLSSRRLDWRSALGSYAVFQHLPAHTPFRTSRGAGRCLICGSYLNHIAEDWNVLNFERFKWGGVRHDDVSYAALDMKLFLESKPPTPMPDDLRIFRNIIASIAAVPPGVTSSDLHLHFAKAFKSNKAERQVFVCILGFCGILGTPEHPGFTDSFVDYDSRTFPARGSEAIVYPASWWRASVGINQSNLKKYFGHVL